MNTEGRSRSLRRILVAALAGAAAGVVAGCGPIDEVTGEWHATAVLDVVRPDAAPAGCYLDDLPYLDLVLGQYGDDVAGLVKLAEDRARATDDDPCCTPISGGKLRGDRLTFTFPACSGDVKGVVFSARLRFSPHRTTPTLEGALYVGESSDDVYAAVRLDGSLQEDLPYTARKCRVDDEHSRCVSLAFEGADASGADDTADAGENADAGP